MRRIKFRARAVPQNEWIYGHYCFASKAFGLPFDTPTIQQFNTTEDRTLSFRQINHSTVGQYTGLHDRAGNEIYEGDILCEIDTNRKVAVVYEAPMFCYADNIFGYKFLNLPENFVIIGNIHDNPELLKSL